MIDDFNARPGIASPCHSFKIIHHQSDILTWQAVAADPDLLRDAAATDPTDAAGLARLRKHHPADAVGVALDLVRARQKAVAKFPDRAATLIADPQGVEQASSATVACYKARQFEDAGLTHVADLCCGIGGDTMALAEQGLQVIGVDLDPVRAWMAEQNAGCPTRCADVAHADLPTDTAIHIDPARRTDAGRVHRLADHLPDPATVSRLIDRHSTAMVKLSPAVDLDDLANALPPGRVEFLSEAGRLVQALHHTGRLAPDPAHHTHTATRIDPDGVHQLSGLSLDPASLPTAPPDAFLYTIDPAVERAGLIHQLGLPLIHPRLGLLTSPESIRSPWLSAFKYHHSLPLRLKKLKSWLRDHDAGIVEVKTRGKAVDPDTLQKQLRGNGRTPFTVFAMRWDKQLIALVTERQP